jgi:hypothetical protein
MMCTYPKSPLFPKAGFRAVLSIKGRQDVAFLRRKERFKILVSLNSIAPLYLFRLYGLCWEEQSSTEDWKDFRKVW